MRDFHCPNCGQRLTFENSACLACGSPLGFSLDEMALLVLTTGDDADRAGFVSAAHTADDITATIDAARKVLR